MGYNLKQILERIKKPEKSDVINDAIRHENRLQFHTDVCMKEKTTKAYQGFLKFVKALLPDDKYQMFCSLFKFPVETNELMEQIYNSLYKLFDGRDPVENYEFTDVEYKVDFEEYRKLKKFDDFWKINAWEEMKTHINSMVVVDLPEVQTSTSPEPYVYFLRTDDIIDFDDNKGDVTGVIFNVDDNIIAAYDDEYYRVIELDDKRNYKRTLIENQHDLGYCPAQWFWSTTLNNNNPNLKANANSNQLTKIDWYLFYSVGKKHLDLYASYPIHTYFEVECDFKTNISENVSESCNHGFLQRSDGNYALDENGLIKRCPKCSIRALNGPGSSIEVPYPEESGDFNAIEAVKIIPPDKVSLTYNVEEVKRIRTEIYTNVTGYASEITNMSVNEKQIEASFESRSVVLRQQKKNFELAKKWAMYTIARLRYGKRIMSVSINLGNEFYLFSEEELIEMYSNAKNNGVSDVILDYLSEQILETKYRNNPEKLQRAKIIYEITPYPHLSNTELLENKDSLAITDEELTVRLQLINYIKRFERENGNIVRFGDNIEYSKKIEIINKTLRSYGSTEENNRNSSESNSGESGRSENFEETTNS